MCAVCADEVDAQQHPEKQEEEEEAEEEKEPPFVLDGTDLCACSKHVLVGEFLTCDICILSVLLLSIVRRF